MDLSVASCCVTTNVIYVRYKVSLGLSRRLRANFRACRPSACCSALVSDAEGVRAAGRWRAIRLLLERAAVCWPGAVR